jgi:hypothetical protein
VLDVDDWDAWQPARVAELFAGVEAPWCVAAGWAIELFLGDRSREHEDLEVAVPRPRFGELAARFGGLELYVPLGEGRLGPFDADSESHQTWVREPGGPWRLDVFREPADGDTWICRRDASIRMRYDELIEWTADGIPYMRPDVVLLFKAKHAREKDGGDFEAAAPRLGAERRDSLRCWLELVHPGHRWLERL